MKLLWIIILVFTVEPIIGNYQYCSMQSCQRRVHIGCNAKWAFSSNCPSNAKLVALSDGQKNRILNNHNYFRNRIASGAEPRFNPSVRMATMTWNKELEYLAALNVFQCQIMHDQCRNTQNYDFVGQNLAWKASTGGFQNLDFVISDSIFNFYNEITYASQYNIDNCCGSSTGRVIGHFTQMVTDGASQIGCAIAQYYNRGWYQTLLACNYSKSNVVGTKIYISGQPASQCKNRNPFYPALCAVNEPINPNILSY